MARKIGLNRKEQLQAAKWMKEGISAKDIAKKFHTSAEVVKRFTQEKLDEADERARKRAEGQNRVLANKRRKAEVLKEAIELTGKDAANAEEFK